MRAPWMRGSLIVAALLLVAPLLARPAAAQVPTQDLETMDHSIGQVAISFNPLGFVQFGPLVNLEFGVRPDLAVNLHVRLLTLGAMTYVVSDHSDGLDGLSGIGVGGGLLYFFGDGLSKPYLGGFVEYSVSDALYAEGAQWEWSETTNVSVFITNGGYRFRFDSGFFVNTGAFLGAGFSNWDWDYADPTYGTGGTGTDVVPFGMLELAFGLEF